MESITLLKYWRPGRATVETVEDALRPGILAAERFDE